MNVQELPLDLLVEAEWNANRIPRPLLEKLRRSITEFGVVENLVARPHPQRAGLLEVISGNHRLRLFRELGVQVASVVVVELDDAAARLLAQTLNRTRGSDDPDAYARLVEELLASFEPARVAGFLPETEATLDRLLHEYRGSDGLDELVQVEVTAEPRSRLGEVYQLGAHRLLCGDAPTASRLSSCSRANGRR